MPFIVFEGPDGCGKTTIIQKIYQSLKDEVPIVLTREPGGTEISEKIRDLILDNENNKMSDRTEALLYAASRAQHIDELIRPSLEKGKWVLCDRFILSSLAYQGYGRLLGEEDVLAINQFAIQEMMPDLIFYFDLDAKSSLERKRKQKELDRMEIEGELFHKRVINGYKSSMKKFDQVICINASKSIDEVYEDCMNIMKDRYLI